MMDLLQTFLQQNLPVIQFRLVDLLDIAILAFIIYKVLWILRKTSSGRVMRGILVLVGAMWLSSYLELTATTFLSSRIITSSSCDDCLIA